MNYELSSTICATATPTGGAIAVIRISGEKTFDVLAKIFSKDLTDVAANTLHYGHIMVPGREPYRKQEIIDNVIVSVFRAPYSYTGEEAAEISCHGSRYIIQRILELLINHGARQAHPGEFPQRAFLNGKMDLSQAEAVADLIASTNAATHRMAMSQLRGEFSSELASLREQLLRLTTLLELELDFSDHEDLKFADRQELYALAQKIDNHIQRLTCSFQTGNAIKQGIPVAIVGAPNVGKSTLLNALLGEERAIVSDIQGTTRDTIEDTIELEGVTFRFIDTAGLRHTHDTVELMGIERSMAAVRQARIIILMTEPEVPFPDLTTRDDQTVITIINKTDSFQAKYGIGIENLKQQLTSAAPAFSDSDVIVTNVRHYNALCRAQISLRRVLQGINTGLSGDLLSEDLRQTLDILAEITGGQITPQETLNNIFSHFCVGK